MLATARWRGTPAQPTGTAHRHTTAASHIPGNEGSPAIGRPADGLGPNPNTGGACPTLPNRRISLTSFDYRHLSTEFEQGNLHISLHFFFFSFFS